MATGERLKREAAGRYVSADGRFTVEQSSGRWMTVDAEETDDLGLPLVRGPFATLDDARTAIEEARTGPGPTSDLASRVAARPGSRQADARGRTAKGAAPGRSTAARGAKAPAKPREPVIALRDYEPSDGEALRALWNAVGFRSVGDDDRSLAAFAKRNPRLLIVATADDAIVASALGAWDGRRGWLYHVATGEPFRRKGIATRLVHRLEQRLRTGGAPKVSAIVRDENGSARAFWEKLGYEVGKSRNFGKEL